MIDKKSLRTVDHPSLHSEGRIEQLVTLAERFIMENRASELREILARLQKTANRHFDYEESPEGLYAEIVEQHPQLDSVFSRLAKEHEIFRSSYETWRKWNDSELLEKKAEIQEILDQMKKHEELERDVILEAYYRDLVAQD